MVEEKEHMVEEELKKIVGEELMEKMKVAVEDLAAFGTVIEDRFGKESVRDSPIIQEVEIEIEDIEELEGESRFFRVTTQMIEEDEFRRTD